jgi:hypothetical protein
MDDLMAQSSKDKRIADLFTKGSHHRNLSIIYIVQNIFHQGKEMRNISLNTHKSPKDKQQISMLGRQVNPGKVQEFMRSYEDATSRPHGYLMLDLKPTTDDQYRLKANVLPGEIANPFIQKQSYRQPPLVNVMYDAEQRMKEIMDVPQLSAVEKRKIYSDQLNRFLTLKNKMVHSSPGIPETSAQSIPQAPAEMPQPNESVEIAPPVPATPKTNFPTPPPTEEERPKLKRNFFHNWVDSADWRLQDLAMLTPEAREDYERFLLSDRPKYIPMKAEQVAKLSPEDRQEYDNSLKITKTPRRYTFRSRPY